MIELDGKSVLVADAQIHIWRDEDEAHPWNPLWHTYAHRDGKSPTPDELISEMDRAGVDRAVLVPPSFAGDDNEVAIEAAQQFPNRFAVMARTPLETAEHPDLAPWMARPEVLGFRLTFARGPSAAWLTDGTADWFWEKAEAAAAPLMVYSPQQVGALGPILERHPSLRVIIDHAGLPTTPPPMPMEEIVAETFPLARFSNVAVKASAFPCATTESYPFPVAQRCTRALVEHFGPERVFWGTDFTRLPCAYAEAVQYLGAVGGLRPAELASVMGSGLCNWLGWNS